MTRVKLNLTSGSVQEREVVTAFTNNGVKYVIFDGESTGSMGLPIILVSKDALGKVVGITDAEEWKNTKECLKKIISGEKVDYAAVDSELKADDVYYRQLTLPIASFDILKSSYSVPEGGEVQTPVVNETPIFEPITPEEVAGGAMPNVEPVAPSVFNTPIPDAPVVPSEVVPDINPMPTIPGVEPVVPTVEPVIPDAPVAPSEPVVPEVAPIAAPTPVETPVENAPANNYEELKKEFMTAAEELFNNLYNKLNQ